MKYRLDALRGNIYRLLRASEKYFKADMVYVAKGGFWITFNQIASNVISLLLVIAFANLLPKETYGLYRYILSLAGVLSIFTLTGMNSAVARAVATGNEGALRAAVKYQLKWNLLMVAAFFGLGGYYFLNSNTLFAASFFLLGLFVPATFAFNTYGAYLEGKREFRAASIFSVISTFIYAGGLFVAMTLSKEVVWLIAAYAVTTFASTLFFYSMTLRIFKPSGSVGEDTLRYGRELTLIGFIAPIASQIDKIILTHFWGPAQLAIYSLALAVPERAVLFTKNLMGLGAPKFATKTPAEINTVFYRRIAQGMGIGLFTALAYVLVAPYLFRYLLPQYLDSVFYSQLLAASLLFAMPNRYVSLLLVSQKFSRIILVNNTAQSILRILLYITFGATGGILGLILANILYSLIGMLVNIVLWRKNTKI